MEYMDGNPRESYRVDLLPDIEYARVDGQALRLQILRPCRLDLSDAPRLPLVAYIKGSGWNVQRRLVNVVQLGDIARNGFVVASIEYRPMQAAKYPAQVQDANRALAYLCTHADEYGIDTGKVCLMGDSSGAHTALLAGMARGQAMFLAGVKEEKLPQIRAIVDLYGPAHMPSFEDGSKEMETFKLDLFGQACFEDPKYLEKASPLWYADAEKLPPILIIHGDEDDVVPIRQSEMLLEALLAHGHSTRMVCVLGAGHGTRFWSAGLVESISAFLAENTRGK